jgi:hypothetical protein
VEEPPDSKKDFIVPAWGPDNEANNKIYTLLYGYLLMPYLFESLNTKNKHDDC